MLSGWSEVKCRLHMLPCDGLPPNKNFYDCAGKFVLIRFTAWSAIFKRYLTSINEQPINSAHSIITIYHVIRLRDLIGCCLHSFIAIEHVSSILLNTFLYRQKIWGVDGAPQSEEDTEKSTYASDLR